VTATQALPATRPATVRPPVEESRGRRGSRRIGNVALRIGVLVAAGLVWELYARTFPSLFFPPLSAILENAWNDWVTGEWDTLFVAPVLLDMLGASFARLLPGLLYGVLAGIVLGVALARVRVLGEMFSPLIQFFRAIPSSAKIPLFMALMGIGDAMKIWVIAISVALPLLMNVMDGVRNIDPTLLAVAKVYRVGRWNRLWGIILPASSPQTFAGLRIATMVALIVLVLSELTGAANGIGYYVLYAQRMFQVDDMWAGVLVLGLLGYLLNSALSLAESRILRWHRQSTATAR
jgi:ABC-type nitrate/sulfonate/bicarbonate transport system permease component